MATTITSIIGIEWVINNGAPFGDPVENPNYFGGFEPFTEFTWNDVSARLIGGPEPLSDYWIEGKVFEDTRTLVISEPDSEGNGGGETLSDTVARIYLPYVLTSMGLTSTMQNDWDDVLNPAKPKQFGGPIKYVLLPLEPPAPLAGGSRVGIKNNQVAVAGFVANEAALPEGRIYGDDTFYINLENGVGYVWADGGVAGGSWQWCRSGIAHDPALINANLLGSVDDLPEDAPNGTWQGVATGVYGTLYAKDNNGWMNIGPIQGLGPLVPIEEDARKYYTSGYIYSLVFDRSDFRYVPRMSGGTQGTYQGEVNLNAVGWFPQTPLDRDRDIYPMDTITKFKPDNREFVSINYTATLTTSVITGSASIIQDVYQPTSNWGSLMNELLDMTYFKNGIYH